MAARDTPAALKSKFYPKGSELARQGGRSNSLFVIRQGLVEIVRDGLLIQQLRLPGTILGEMSILLDRPHSATVRAATDVEVFEIADALTMLESHPKWLMQIARLLAHHLDSTTSQLLSLKQRPESEPLVIPRNLVSALEEEATSRQT